MQEAMAKVTGGLAMLRLSLRRRRQLLPWLFLGPGLLWLIVFFAIPLLNQAQRVAAERRPRARATRSRGTFSTYTNAISDYSTQFVRSIGYAAIATILCLIIGFPLAYFTAFKAGRYKNLILLLIILPFFVSYVLRTVAWQLILSDNGWVVEPPARRRAWSRQDGRLLATRTAVIAGITYNFLPFMVLPLYVSLEKIDRRLIEAATDLYASRTTAFRKVTLPLALPGIFAGSLLTFIPACGDFINAALLGTPRQYMIGNVIQSKFLNILDYPTAAALSFILMTFILVGIFIYARLLGDAEPDRGGVLMAVASRRQRPGPPASGGVARLLVGRSALLYLFIPIFIVVLFSFNDNKGRFNFTWQGFTLDHWAHPFADPDLATALKNSLVIALISTLIATALGTFMALALVRYRFRGRGVVDFFVFLPLSTPEVVLGAALLALFLTAGRQHRASSTIIIAHVMFTVSYVVVTVKARLEGMDRHIEEAAMDLGATEWATFRKVTLPMIAPGVAAAALLAAAISIDDYVITSFNAGQTQTFPLFIFGATRQGVPRRGQRAGHRRC